MKIPTKKDVILRIATIIAFVEFAIMFVFANLTFDVGKYVEAILDVIILILLSTPLIYIWVIKPYIDSRDEAVRQISHMAYHDALTKLANRRFLNEYLGKLVSRLVRSQTYGAILFIDLDGFKVINDKNGHDAGDVILIEIAKRLASTARGEDLVSRIGGDEFVVLLSDLDAGEKLANDKAQVVAERILKKMKKEICFRNTSLQVGASIGLRLLAPEAISADTALRDADTAMYRAKKAGKGNLVVYCN